MGLIDQFKSIFSSGPPVDEVAFFNSPDGRVSSSPLIENWIEHRFSDPQFPVYSHPEVLSKKFGVEDHESPTEREQRTAYRGSTGSLNDEAQVLQDVGNTESQRVQGRGTGGQQESPANVQEKLSCCTGEGSWTTHWQAEPRVGRVADGIPRRVDRIRALGNAVVPQIPEIIGRAILAT